MIALVYDALRVASGTISAGHGIGIKKKSYLSHSRNPAELEVMATIKRAVDSNSILNAGRVIFGLR